MNEAATRIAHPRDWVELTSAFLQIRSFVDEGGARARVRALECINRDLPEKRLRAALVAPDNTIIKILEKSDFQGRTVCSPLNPAEGVWIEPPFEEGRRVCISRTSLDEWYSTHPATPAAAADRRLPAAGEPEPSQSPQAKQQPPPAIQPKRKSKRKLKRKPRRKADPDRERIYNHEAVTGTDNRVLIEPPPRPSDSAPETEHVVWAVRFLRITEPDKLVGLRGKKLQRLVCTTVGPKFWCGLRTVQRGKKRADSM